MISFAFQYHLPHSAKKLQFLLMSFGPSWKEFYKYKYLNLCVDWQFQVKTGK
ncbi:unnamed protein product [Larinioides sclopetarius]|uniref:Uncharacterized protein n=1 Tax=Larinioides sclopetarius TaxID=280406 RepID=A0AAV2AJ20_9ARAC